MRLIYILSAAALLLGGCKKEFSEEDPTTDLLRKIVAVKSSGDSVVAYFYYNSKNNFTEYRELVYQGGVASIYQINLNWDETQSIVRDYQESFYNETEPEVKTVKKLILNYEPGSQQYVSKFVDPVASSPVVQQDSIVYSYDATGRLRSQLQFIRFTDDPVYRRFFFSEYSYKGGYNITGQTDSIYLMQYGEDGNPYGDSAYLNRKTEYAYDDNFNPVRFSRKIAYVLGLNLYAASSNLQKRVVTDFSIDLQSAVTQYNYNYTYESRKPKTCEVNVLNDAFTSLTRLTYYYQSDRPAIP